MRRALLPAVLPLFAGCYAYTPIEPAAVRPGTSVRARVSAAGAQRIAPLLGTSDARLLDGTLVDVRPDTMILQVPTVLQATVGSARETLHQRLSIPRSDLLELETRRLDRVRTGIVAGSVALIVGAIVIRSLEKDPGREGPPGGNGGPEARVPVGGFRF